MGRFRLSRISKSGGGGTLSIGAAALACACEYVYVQAIEVVSEYFYGVYMSFVCVHGPIGYV